MKYLLTTLTISSLVVLTGCSSTELPTNTNETGDTNSNAQVVANTNTVVVANTNESENTNETVNENVNTSEDVTVDEVDTSSWLTYTNEEYGFSLKYLKEWKMRVTESTFDSKIIEEQKIKGYQWFLDDEFIFAIYPEGEFDSDRFLNAKEVQIEVDGFDAIQLGQSTRRAVIMKDYPLNTSPFRVEIFYDENFTKDVSDEIIASLNITKN